MFSLVVLDLNEEQLGLRRVFANEDIDSLLVLQSINGRGNLCDVLFDQGSEIRFKFAFVTISQNDSLKDAQRKIEGRAALGASLSNDRLAVKAISRYGCNEQVLI